MVYLIFLVAVVVTVISATKLSTYADAISRLSGLGALLIGTFLLAVATALPEVTTTVSAIYLDNPDLAVGNIFGSNHFNLLILAVFDLIFRKRKMLAHIHRQQRYTALFGVFMTLIMAIAIFATVEIPFLGIGIEAIFIIALYLLSLWIIQRTAGEEEEDDASENDSREKEKYSMKHAVIGFIITAIIIFISGTALTFSGDEIAVITGLGSSFVGSFLIAVSTSLPEVVTVWTALKLNNENLAAASIFGSNLFNMVILVVCDLLYAGSLLQAASMSHTVTVILLLMNSALVSYAVFFDQRRRFYTWPSLLMVLFYVLTMVWLFLV
ncbi:sodium:calcium antiporter [Salicibibacter halophilus]|uniref:Sodium:calcium antiporter n=1 Tax=Salicibibacter halophilus TaxID=2502791 RepID=A0A514LGA7_9BACI|nr:sodium:calcium antiporter [Salicibibacter halophilus]QDI90886.1 sodium:calcium antiporter [Salicibibacter halophilus]